MGVVPHSLLICEFPPSQKTTIIIMVWFTTLQVFIMGASRSHLGKFWGPIFQCISVTKYHIPLSSTVVSSYLYLARDISNSNFKFQLGGINYV